MGFEFFVRYQPLKFLRLTSEFNAFYFKEEGMYRGQNLDVDGRNWQVRLNTDWRLPLGIKLQTRFDYNAPIVNAQTKRLAIYSLNFGLNKNFMKDKLTVSISGFNILNSREYRVIADSEDFYIDQSSRRYGPRYNISFRYKFNQTERDRMRSQNRRNR